MARQRASVLRQFLNPKSRHEVTRLKVRTPAAELVGSGQRNPINSTLRCRVPAAPLLVGPVPSPPPLLFEPLAVTCPVVELGGAVEAMLLAWARAVKRDAGRLWCRARTKRDRDINILTVV